MKNLTLKDLYNPNGIIGIYVCPKNVLVGTIVECNHQTAFQEYEGSVELWQETETGIIRIQRWLKKTIHSAEYSDKWNEDTTVLEPLRTYISPTTPSK